MQEAPKYEMPEAIRLGGCAFLIAWFLLFFSGEIWGLDYERAAESVVVLSLVSIAGCLITLVILNILGRKGRHFTQTGGRYFLFIGLLLCLGTIGTTLGSMVPWAVYILACLAVGCSGAFFICAVIIQFSRFAPRTILINCGVAFLIGIFIYSFAFYVPRAITIPLICILPLLACPFFAFDKVEAIPFVHSDTTSNSKAPVGWHGVVLLSVFMLFSCVVRGYLPFYMDNEAFSYIRSLSIILMLIMGAIAVIVPLLLPDKAGLGNMYRVILLSGVVFFALFPIFGMDNSVVLILADGYRGLCALLTITLFACMAKQAPFFGFKNVGGGICIFVAFGLIGWSIGTILHYADLSDDILRIYSSIQCVLVLLAFVLLYRQPEIERYVGSSLGASSSIGMSAQGTGQGDEISWLSDSRHPIDEPSDSRHPVKSTDTSANGSDSVSESLSEASRQSSHAEDKSDERRGGGRWRQRLGVIAEEKGLTAREEEVFILLAKGFKAQNISERLSVSYNTTRAHIRNIYQKLDVHSQQEFIDLIESDSQE